jgi:hypothetical protein
MKAAKTFDCLRMKRELQAKLNKKWGATDDGGDPGRYPEGS